MRWMKDQVSEFEETVKKKTTDDSWQDYPMLSEYTHVVKPPERKIVGREKEVDLILSTFHRPELSNIILLAEPGAGKTALVQATSVRDPDREYLEIDMSKLITNLANQNEMAARLKSLFGEAQEYYEKTGSEIVLFIDEFHQIVQLSSAAVEALKPLLADSATRGIRVIVATTYDEFNQFVARNLALVERLTRVNIRQPDKATTVEILKGMAGRYEVLDEFYSDALFELIYEYTEQYMPASSQPRKSILVLDAMIGWHRKSGASMDAKLLAKVLYETQGVDVAMRLDATTIKEKMDSRVFAQDYATSTVAERLQLCVADLNDPEKPMSSFLFTGATGTGKGLLNSEKIPVWDPEGEVFYKLNGELKVGDYVFNRKGQPVRVLGVFPQGKKEVYKVCFNDGRSLITDDSHLWTYSQSNGKDLGKVHTRSTKELYEEGLYHEDQGSKKLKYWIPKNHAVERPELSYDIDPYLVGTFIKKDALGGIPERYKYGSIAQRWRLIQGVFDAEEEACNERNFFTTSETLAQDLQEVLYSLGVFNTLDILEASSKEYCLKAQFSNEARGRFLNQARPADTGSLMDDWIGISEIIKLDRKEDTTCIYIEDEEHLYQAGDYLVTHNTELSRTMAELLFSDSRALIRMDMTEYALPESLERFRDELTRQVWARPNSIVLLDEVEKACAPVTRVLLQVLDDGRLLDGNGREVTFTNAYIIMTTNAGSEIYKTIGQYSSNDTGSGEIMEEYDKLIRRSITETSGDNRFPPELLGRIDCIVPFQPLSEKTMKRIVHNKLKHLQREVFKKHNVQLVYDDRVIDYIVLDNLSTETDQGGARQALSKLESEVTVKVARFINEYPSVINVGVKVEGKMVAEDPRIRKSQAKIVVGQVKAKSA